MLAAAAAAANTSKAKLSEEEQLELNDRLSRAAHFGEETGVIAALEAGADLESRTDDIWGHTPLIRACKSGNSAVVQLLLQRGAGVHGRCNSNWTPAHWASSAGKLDALKALVEGGADVSKRTGEGWTVKSVAESKRQTAVVEYLSAKGF